MRREKLSAPAVAIIALDGMQSHRCAAPPTMSRSTRVTWAPRLAARLADLVAGRTSPDHDNIGHRVARVALDLRSRSRPQAVGWTSRPQQPLLRLVTRHLCIGGRR